MKLTVLQFEGTPEEFDASEAVRELVAHHRTTNPVTAAHQDPGNGRVPGVADEGQDTVRGLLGRNPARGLFVRFLAGATSWDKVGAHGIKRQDAKPEVGLDYGSYLRLRRQGSQMGGFAYVYAETGLVNLRLQLTEAELNDLGASHARPLRSGHHAYRVNISIVDEVSLKQALQLAKLAYDAT